MPEFDLLIKNAKILDEQGLLLALSLGVKDEKIAFIGFDCPDSFVSNVRINAGGSLLLPSFIDLHVHIFSPGWNKEDYSTGTMAAAVGGYGLVCDMASVGEWQTTTKEVFKKKIEEVEKNAWIDVALYAGEIYKDADLTEIPELMDMGAVGLGEIMMSEPGAIGDDALLLKAMEVVSEKNKLIAVHCENGDIINYMTRVRKPVKDLREYANTRPPIAEAEAILRTAMLSRYKKTRVHVCHVSSKAGSFSLRLAKRLNKHIICY
ncbi:MAG: dihydroorotase family protein [Zestosphaera sp.]